MTLTIAEHRNKESIEAMIVRAARSDPGDYRSQYEQTIDIWNRLPGLVPEPPADQLAYDRDPTIRTGVQIFNELRHMLRNQELNWEKKVDIINSALRFLEVLVANRAAVKAEYEFCQGFYRERMHDAPVRENVCRDMEMLGLPHHGRYPSELNLLRQRSRQSILESLDQMDQERENEKDEDATYFYEDELEDLETLHDIHCRITQELSFMAALRRTAELMSG